MKIHELTHIDLFAGIGGFTRAAEQVGQIKTVQFVEIDQDAKTVLRSNYPSIPIHPDIRAYHPPQGIDIYTIGFPCTGTSVAGPRTGLDHEESALWFQALRIIREGIPPFIIIENPTGLLDRGMETVLWGLSESGYDAEWETISASALGAPHQRDRVFIIAYSQCLQWRKRPTRWTGQMRCMVQEARAIARFPSFERTNDGIVARFPSGLDAVPIGVSRSTPGRIRCRFLFGRTVVPACAAIAIRRVLYLNSCLE